MKIIRLTTSLDFGGQEKQYLSLTEYPQLLNNEYVFAAIGNGGYTERVLTERGFKVKVFGKNPNVKNIAAIWELYQWFRKEKPDVLHTAAAEANFHGVIAGLLAGIKTIYAEEIGLPQHSKKAQWVFRQLYRKINGVICVSKSVKNCLITKKEINENQGLVVYNPVSIAITEVLVPRKEFEIIYVGRLEKNKNVSFLIEGFSQLVSKKDLFLTIVGDGRERKNLEKQALELGILQKIQFVGFSSSPEKWVSRADLFVLPSKSEGFGIAVVEAMYQGIPCLCSNVGGIPEFIVDGKSGWLFDPNNESQFVAKFSHIVNLSTPELKSIGRHGKQSVINRFSVASYIKNIEEIYEQS